MSSRGRRYFRQFVSCSTNLPPNSADHLRAWVHGGFEDCPSRAVPDGGFSSGERPLSLRYPRLPPRYPLLSPSKRWCCRLIFSTLMSLFNAGEVIISQEPYVFVPNSAEPRCDHCFASARLRKCSACQAVWYCGSSCQVCSTGLAKFSEVALS